MNEKRVDAALSAALSALGSDTTLYEHLDNLEALREELDTTIAATKEDIAHQEATADAIDAEQAPE